MVMSWTVFKLAIFSFPFLPPAIHSYMYVPKYILKYVFNNWCVQHQGITYLFTIQPYSAVLCIATKIILTILS